MGNACNFTKRETNISTSQGGMIQLSSTIKLIVIHLFYIKIKDLVVKNFCFVVVLSPFPFCFFPVFSIYFLYLKNKQNENC